MDCEAAQCRRDVGRLNAEVYGNGHPERSLRVRMDRVERQLASIKRMAMVTLAGMWSLVLLFVGAWITTLF